LGWGSAAADGWRPRGTYHWDLMDGRSCWWGWWIRFIQRADHPDHLLVMYVKRRTYLIISRLATARNSHRRENQINGGWMMEQSKRVMARSPSMMSSEERLALEKDPLMGVWCVWQKYGALGAIPVVHFGHICVSRRESKFGTNGNYFGAKKWVYKLLNIAS
jgi:hypothetical protein